jgi:hypothetical protein
MATDTVLYKRTMLEAFKQKASPTMFLSSWFKTGSRDMFRSKKCVIDVKRNQEKIAVDIVRGTSGRLVNNKRFTTKEYEPPVYDLYNAYSEEELNKRMPGQIEYSNPDYMSELLALITDDQVEIQDMILRAIEKQASDALFTGTITPVSADVIDFKQKTAHNFAAGTAWSSTSSTPWVDLKNACELNRKNGKVMTGVFNAIMSETSLSELITRLTATSRSDQLNAKLTDITLPVKNTAGAVFHGRMSAGSYLINLWTYPQFYTIPDATDLGGIALSGAGTTVPYIPDERVLVIPDSSAIDLRLVYAGIPQLVNRVEGQFRLPSMRTGDFHPYAFTDDEKVTAKVGLRSAPLAIPTQIDGFSVIQT